MYKNKCIILTLLSKNGSIALGMQQTQESIVKVKNTTVSPLQIGYHIEGNPSEKKIIQPQASFVIQNSKSLLSLDIHTKWRTINVLAKLLEKRKQLPHKNLAVIISPWGGFVSGYLPLQYKSKKT